ncbi:hypothetical protein DNAM_650 [Pseudomonas phage BroderSalsa]|nr:hypothetical protein DNAM_650 [Pseudomonas phage BroderSalsa]
MGKVSELAFALSGEQQPEEAQGGTVTPPQLPAVGDTVLVRHRSQENAQGVVNLVRDGNSVELVKAVMIGSEHGPRVKVSSGDVWDVKRCSRGDTVWETVFVRYQG